MSIQIPEINWKDDARIDQRRQIPCKTLPPLQYSRCALDKEQFVHRIYCVFAEGSKAVEALWWTETNDTNEHSAMDDAVFKINLAWKKWQEKTVT